MNAPTIQRKFDEAREGQKAKALSTGITKPHCAVHGGQLSAGFQFKGDRYHVWLKSNGALKDSVLYKNPMTRDGKPIGPREEGYFQTKRYNADAQCWKPLVAELLASIDIEKAWADHAAEEKAEVERIKKESQERIARERIEKAAPELLEALKDLVGIICSLDGYPERDVNTAKDIIARAEGWEP